MIPVAALKALPWGLLARVGLVLALLGAAYYQGHKRGADGVQRKWDKATLSAAISRADALESALAVQQDLQALIDQARKDRRNEAVRIDRLHGAVLDSLRDRPQRPAGVDLPAPAGAGQPAGWATGASLYREDGEFLAGEARRADVLRSALIECRAGYQAARERIDAINRQVGNGAAP